MVYVVVTEGKTLVDPVTGTVPIPWSMLALVAPVELHDSVVDSPAAMGFGSTEMLTAGG